MYRINLYPAGLERRAARTGRLRGLLAMSFVIVVGTLFLGLFVASSLAFKSQADAIEGIVASHKERLEESVVPGGRVAINQARLILDRKGQRYNWSPLLAELGRLIPNQLMLERIEATSNRRSSEIFSGMTLSGRLRGGRDVDPVVAFCNQLNASSLYREQFAESRVDRVDTSGDVPRFVIHCPFKSSGNAGDSEDSGG